MTLPPHLRCAAVGAVADGDAVVTFNFRADRMVEISQALEYEKFDHFDRKRRPDVGARSRAGGWGLIQGIALFACALTCGAGCCCCLQCLQASVLPAPTPIPPPCVLCALRSALLSPPAV